MNGLIRHIENKFANFLNFKRKGRKMLFRKGERVKVVGMTSGHGQAMGTRLTVTGYANQFVRVRENGMNYYEIDLESIPLKLDEIKKECAKAELGFLKAKAKLEYMEETGIEELEEDEYKSHMAQKVIEDENIPVEEKVKKIEALYKEED